MFITELLASTIAATFVIQPLNLRKLGSSKSKISPMRPA